MSAFARTDRSLIGQWWWTIDRWILIALVIITAIGAIMSLAASPAVAERIGLDTFYFAKRQFVFLSLSLAVMFATSLLSHRGVRRLGMVVFVLSIILMIAVLIFGSEIKGATRWLQLGVFSLQPSEFVKPGFVVIAAWFFARRRLEEEFPGYAAATILMFLVVGLLLMQPDVGMSVVVAAVWAVQFFLAGLPLMLVGVIALGFMGVGVGAYFMFDHVQARIDRFLDPGIGASYQVMRSLQAFRNGGLFGRGPGEGRVKEVLPDAHADFIFAVVGEEFGLIMTLILVALFAFVVLRGFSRALKAGDLFVLLAAGGLLAQFGFQVLINMASTVNLMPPKGMTLPFISYGGSSALALAVGTGMILALTREQPGDGGAP